MSFTTPATRHEDIPIFEPGPRQLPQGNPIPMPIFTRPVRMPELVPLKREERR
jgi:hypothetical protein